MSEYKNKTEKLLQFISNSPSAYQAVEEMKKAAAEKKYIELFENEDWVIKEGESYFVTRNDSSFLAFSLPKTKEIAGFHIVASHSDSPTFKVKENAEIKVENKYVKLNTEGYGGMIMSSWLDRPLSVAGRVTVKENDKIVSRPVHVKKDLLVIPNVAIHMNRKINSGMEYNLQTDLLPLFGEADAKKHFMDIVAKAAGVKADEILGHDLFLYVREKGCSFGGAEEYVIAPRLDDLQCAYSSLQALLESKPESYINICVVFDNEEVGSGTRQGADSTFLEDVLYRITESLGKKESWLRQMIAESLLISADNAHALHPNHPEFADPTNRPFLNGGIVIKYHGSQKYTTDAITTAQMKELCKEAEVPFQTFTNRSDMGGGSTLGNISTAHVSFPSVDIGLPQLAMHSAMETAGVKDTEYAIKMMKVFYAK